MKSQPWGHGDFVAISAMRYAMGRRSYIVSMTTEWIRLNWRDFDEEARRTMKRDLKEEIERTDRIPGNLGMDFDEREWKNLYAFMDGEKL